LESKVWALVSEVSKAFILFLKSSKEEAGIIVISIELPSLWLLLSYIESKSLIGFIIFELEDLLLELLSEMSEII